MEGIDEKKLRNRELLTQEYSVLITDAHRSSHGSGVLYYQGNEVYVFTCAHVVDMLEDPMELYIFIPQNREPENYMGFHVVVNHSQTVYSPLDMVRDAEGERTHTVDAAVIHFSLKQLIRTEGDTPLDKTQYYIAESSYGEKAFFQGFPGGEDMGSDDLLDSLDKSYAEVLHSPLKKDTFTLKIHDDAINQANRVYELEGFSGSPVWSSEQDALSLLGIISAGVGKTVYRNKVTAIKASVIRSIMKTRFNVLMETRLTSVPEEEVAGGCGGISTDTFVENGNIVDGMSAKKPDKQSGDTDSEGNAFYDGWLSEETEKIKANIDELQFQAAIDVGVAAIKDRRFEQCSAEAIRKHYHTLLYCYEVCFLDKEYEETETALNKNGMLADHDPLRWMEKNYSSRNYTETIQFADRIIAEDKEKKELIQLAKVFRLLSKACLDELPIEESVLKIVDSNEKLLIDLAEADAEKLVYQMVGFAYSSHYKRNTKAIRCFNRSYRLSADYAVLESLACAYYDLAMEGTLRDDRTFIMTRIDREALNKSRECFLILMQKADDLYFTAMLKREGMVMYDVFYFLHDNYRVITLYPRLRSLHLANVTDAQKRDFELKYAGIICQGGVVNLDMFEHLTGADRVLIHLLGTIHELTKNLDYRNPKDLVYPGVEGRILQTIEIVEKNIDRVEPEERENVRVLLINLYGWQRRIFGRDVAQQMSAQVDKIKEESSDKEHFDYLISTMTNFFFENTHSPEEAEQYFINTYSRKPNFQNWMEILQYYKRNWMLDKADALFEDLFLKHMDLVKEDGEEYAYRAYIDYIVRYQRDIKNAISFYLIYKDKMRDKVIRDYWYYELMMYTNSFNNPKEFEEERAAFAEEGLVPEEEFHRTSLIAYMCNLDAENAWRHYSDENPLFRIRRVVPILAPNGIPISFIEQNGLTREGAQFLIWQKKYPPHIEENWNGMLPSKVERTLEYRGEDWQAEIKAVLNGCKLKIEKSMTVDAWGMFLLASKDRLRELENFDGIYVSHLTVARMLEEICHYKNLALVAAIAWLESSGYVKILSPDFEHQLIVREKAKYYEPESAVALALQIGCPAIVGEPELQQDCIDSFARIMIRPNRFDEILEYMNAD